MRVASGEREDSATPPPGASADLSTVVEGSQVLAFYASDELWYVLHAFPAQPIQFCIESNASVVADSTAEDALRHHLRMSSGE